MRSLVFALGCLSVLAVSAKTIYVAENGDDGNADRVDFPSEDYPLRNVQTAVDLAETDDEILVGDGHYYSKNPDGQRVLIVTKKVTIRSKNGPTKTFVDGQTFDSKGKPITGNINMALLKVTADATISGICFTNGCNSTKGNIWKIDGVQARAGAEMTAGTLTNCIVHVRGNWQSWVVYAGGSAKIYDVVVPDMPWCMNGSELAPTVELFGDSVADGLRLENIKYSSYIANTPISLYGNAVLRNAIVTGCELGKSTYKGSYPSVVTIGGKARLADSTIAGNYINGPAGALKVNSTTCFVTNCIISANSHAATTWPNLHNGANLARCTDCSSPDFAFDNASNSWRDPRFTDAAAGDYRLLPVSPVPTGGAKSLRAAAPAALACGFDATVRSGRGSVTTVFSGYATATEGVTAQWTFDDETVATGWPTVEKTFTTPGWHGATLVVTTNSVSSQPYARLNEVYVAPEKVYVKEGNAAKAAFPYATWETAAVDIQTAIDTGARDVIVTNGTYAVGPNSTAPDIKITTDARVHSVEGPEVTIVDTGITGTKNGADRRLFTITHADAELFGFSLVGGNSGNYDYTAALEVSAGTVSNCVVRGVRRLSRSCAVRLSGTAKILDTVIDGAGHGVNNYGLRLAGLSLEGTALAERCRVTGFNLSSHAMNDASRHAAVILQATGTILRNSLVCGNTNGTEQSTAKSAGGVDLQAGRIENCTIAGNKSFGYGGGLYIPNSTSAKVCVNTIIADNTAAVDGNDVYCVSGSTCTFLDCCGSDIDKVTGGLGSGCTIQSPSFDPANPYHLSKYSTVCVDKGTTNGTEFAWAQVPGAVDLDGTNRVLGAEIDMGCFEFVPSTEREPLQAKIEVTGTSSGRSPMTVTLVATLIGDQEGLEFKWDFGDGTYDTEHLTVTNVYTTSGSFTPIFWVTNKAGEEQTITNATPVLSVPETSYVSLSGGHKPPFLNWTDASTNVQDAVNLGPRKVLVAAGSYDLTGDAVVLMTDTVLESVEGRDKTFLVGHSGAPWSTKRLVWLKHTGAVVRGFTLRGGSGVDTGDTMVGVVSAGLVEDCFVTDNNIYASRSPIFSLSGTGKLHNVAINVGNPYDYANEGGPGPFWNVTATGNAHIDGLVMTNFYRNYNYGTGTPVFHLTLSGNAVARNVLLKDLRWGPRCKVTGCDRATVQVSENATLENATIVGCEAVGKVTTKEDVTTVSGGVLQIGEGTPTVRNVLLQDNVSACDEGVQDVYDTVSPTAPRITYSRSAELTSGEGNVTAPVRFHNTGAWPCRPFSGSAVINAGCTSEWTQATGALDVRGNLRVLNGWPDISCYETPRSGLSVIVR